MVEERDVVVGDLILTEVLQGARRDEVFHRLLSKLSEFAILPIVDDRVPIAAARNDRALRSLGITVRRTIDTLIATRCILEEMPLLYTDRDFDPFVAHLGFVPALPIVSGALQ